VENDASEAGAGTRRPSDRRKVARIEIDEPVRIVPWGQPEDRAVYGRVVDICSIGFRVRSQYYFARGEVVQARMTGIEFRARARYCRAASDGLTDTGFEILDAIQDPMPLPAPAES
jgi:hypothetical protein